MRRLGRGLSLPLAFALALWLGAAAAPTVTFACVCMAPEPGGPIFNGNEDAVLVGWIGATGPDLLQPVAVERWFKGGDAAVVMISSGRQIHPDGSQSVSSCSVNLNEGAHMILTAGVDGGVLSVGSCSAMAGVDSAQGQALIAAAIDTFGDGIDPRGPPESGDPTIDLATISILAVVGFLAIVVIGVVLSAIGRERSTGPTA